MAVDTTEAFLARIRSYGSMAVALSGGVDSALLAWAAAQALGTRAVAVTAVSPLVSQEERAAAEKVAAAAGMRHVALSVPGLSAPQVSKNHPDRCYHCKRSTFAALWAWAERAGFACVAEGSQKDDLGDDRPGLRALSEMAPQVVSPFLAAGWGKAEIRQLARTWGLFLWDKPSAACLASRLPYGMRLTPVRLAQVEAAEKAVRPFISGALRVRHHGLLARIEVEAAELPVLLEKRCEIAAALEELGFRQVTADLLGYRRGSGGEGDFPAAGPAGREEIGAGEVS